MKWTRGGEVSKGGKKGGEGEGEGKAEQKTVNGNAPPCLRDAFIEDKEDERGVHASYDLE